MSYSYDFLQGPQAGWRCLGLLLRDDHRSKLLSRYAGITYWTGLLTPSDTSSMKIPQLGKTVSHRNLT